MYLDTSVIIKLLTPEPDSAHYAECVDGQCLVISQLAEVEVYAALLAKERAGRLTSEQRLSAWQRFRDWCDADKTMEVLPTGSNAFRKARQIMEMCHPVVPLRTLDALQLAVCDLHQEFPLLSNDQRMLAAAARLGIPVR